MKTYLLLFSLTAFSYAIAQDCFYCPKILNYPWPLVPDWPIEYVKIERIEYPRNEKATFCKRPVEMVDTIVLHHSETPSTDTAERINDLHLDRGTPDDPWYMIAYSYVINSPYPNGKIPIPKVTEGRPLEIVGAHAGSNIFIPMDEDQKKIWEEGKVTCGKENGEFNVDATLVKEGKIKANVTTIGLVVIGNYAPFSRTNPNGYPINRPRYPSLATQDLIARMSCQLQKKHPKIKNIKWHSYYHATSCPGTIKNYLSKIINLTRKYGCEFY